MRHKEAERDRPTEAKKRIGRVRQAGVEKDSKQKLINKHIEFAPWGPHCFTHLPRNHSPPIHTRAHCDILLLVVQLWSMRPEMSSNNEIPSSTDQFSSQFN